MQRVFAPLFTMIFFGLSLCCTKNTDHHVVHTHEGDVDIKLITGAINYLQCSVDDSVTCSWPLRYPVFQFERGDINGDSIDDLVVGVIKKTRYDSVRRKRLFLFQIRHKSVIPLWLGSSLSHPLEQFLLVKSDSMTIIRSIERESDKGFLVAEYQWNGFGLQFRRYLKRNITSTEATHLLEK